MTQTSEFDPHASIKWLAEQEWPCPIYHSANIEPACVHSSPHCPSCQCRGAGCVVPFAALQVERQGIWSHRDCLTLGHCDFVLTDGSLVRNTTDCQGRGWVAERDVEKAHSRLIQFFWNDDDAHGGAETWRYLSEFLGSHRYGIMEGTFRAAKAWVKEHKP